MIATVNEGLIMRCALAVSQDVRAAQELKERMELD